MCSFQSNSSMNRHFLTIFQAPESSTLAIVSIGLLFLFWKARLSRSTSLWPIFLVSVICTAMPIKTTAQGMLEKIVAPNEFATTGGNTFGQPDGTLFQQVFANTQFANTGPIKITALAFRLNESAASSMSTVIGRIDIVLSTVARPMTDLSRSFAANRGSDARTVFSQQNVSLVGQPQGAAGTAPFDIVFQFNQPFLYDPGVGHLGLEYAASARLGQALQVDAHNYGFGNDNVPTRTVYDEFTAISNGGFIAEFSYVTVPEPGVSALLLLAAIFFHLRRRTK
jgi:hypothetical protein